MHSTLSSTADESVDAPAPKEDAPLLPPPPPLLLPQTDETSENMLVDPPPVELKPAEMLKRKLLTESSTNIGEEAISGKIEIASTQTTRFDANAYLDEDLDERARFSLKQATAEQLKKKICILKLRQLDEIRQECVSNLSEQFYLEKNLNYMEYDKWRQANADAAKTHEFVSKRFANKDDVFSLEKTVASKFKCALPLIEHHVNTPTPTR